MPLATIPLDSVAVQTTPKLDPFTRENKTVVNSPLTIDILTNEMYLELPKRVVRVSIATGRPIEQTPKAANGCYRATNSAMTIEAADELYQITEKAYASIKLKLSDPALSNAYGLSKPELRSLSSSLRKMLDEKDNYIAELTVKNPPKQNTQPHIAFDNVTAMEYKGEKDGTHLYSDTFAKKHMLTVKLSKPSSLNKLKGNVYLLTSESHLSGSNTPHYVSTRYIDLNRTILDAELSLSKAELERVTKRATDRFWC